MKSKYVVFYMFLFLISCIGSNPNFSPEKHTKRGEGRSVQVTEAVDDSAVHALYLFVDRYERGVGSFDLEEFEMKWQHLSETKEQELKDSTDYKLWIEITGTLLEFTQKEKYAAELEMVCGQYPELSEWLAPFVITRNLDDIYLNLFMPFEYTYTHSMGGAVSIKQELEIYDGGTVRLHLGMTERRYVAVYVRIPAWTKGATVSVKNVKYFAEPGSYCKIMKKWKEGDVVEIQLPVVLNKAYTQQVMK